MKKIKSLNPSKLSFLQCDIYPNLLSLGRFCLPLSTLNPVCLGFDCSSLHGNPLWETASLSEETTCTGLECVLFPSIHVLFHGNFRFGICNFLLVGLDASKCAKDCDKILSDSSYPLRQLCDKKNGLLKCCVR